MFRLPYAQKSVRFSNRFNILGSWSMCALLLLALAVHSAAAEHFGEDGGTGYNLVGAWSGTNSYNVNDVVTYGSGMYVNIAATAPVTTTTTSGGLTNLFDQSAIVESQVVVSRTGTLFSIGGFESSGYVNVTGASSFVTNVQIYIFDPYGLAFYDSNKNFMSGSFLNGNGVFPAGVPVSVPAGASYVRFWWQLGGMGTTPGAAVLNVGTKLQSTYTPFGVATGATTTTTTIPSAVPTDTTHWAVYTGGTSPVTTTPSASGPWAGKKMFMLGDSIIWGNPAVVGQISSAIGAVPSSKGATGPGIDGFPGRTFAYFDNGQSSTGATIPVSAAVLADVDLLVIALGTNQDSQYGIGLPTDPPSINGTMSSQMRSMLEKLLSWHPGMRIIVVGPYQTNRFNVPLGVDGLLGTYDPAGSMANAASINILKNINTGMKAVCNLYAIPYIDLYNESGVNFSTSALWLRDGLHPNALGYTAFYVPYIAAQLNRIAQ